MSQATRHPACTELLGLTL